MENDMTTYVHAYKGNTLAADATVEADSIRAAFNAAFRATSLPRAGIKAFLRWTDDQEYMLKGGKVYLCRWVDGVFAPELAEV